MSTFDNLALVWASTVIGISEKSTLFLLLSSQDSLNQCLVEPLGSETFDALRMPNPLPTYSEPGCVNVDARSSCLAAFPLLLPPQVLLSALCSIRESIGGDDGDMIPGTSGSDEKFYLFVCLFQCSKESERTRMLAWSLHKLKQKRQSLEPIHQPEWRAVIFHALSMPRGGFAPAFSDTLGRRGLYEYDDEYVTRWDVGSVWDACACVRARACARARARACIRALRVRWVYAWLERTFYTVQR